MELKLLLTLLRRWAWLLLLGAVLGVAGGFAASQYQDPIYQSATKVMVIQPQESSVTANITLNDQELIQTYITLLTTQPVLNAVGEALAYPVSADQVSARRATDTTLLEVTVRASSPQRAADIANTLVEVLIEQNQVLQSNRFASSEESLQAQITQVEQQIEQIQQNQASLSGEASEDTAARRTELASQVSVLRTETLQLEQDISTLAAPALTAAQQEELLQKRLQLAELQIALTAERTAYTSRLTDNPDLRDPETEARIVQLERDIFVIEEDIQELSTPRTDAETAAALIALRSDLAQKRFELELAESEYASLLTSGQTQDQTAVSADAQQQRAALQLYQQLYGNLLSTFESVRLARLQNTPDLIQVEAAAISNIPIQPRPLQNMLLGAAVGLIIMGAVAFVIEYLDDTLKTPDDIAVVLDLPVIGFVSDVPEKDLDRREKPYVVEYPRSAVAESFRILRTNLEFSGVDTPLGTLLVTSPTPGDGKSMIVANLGTVMAHNHKRTVILDCDLRRPRQHRLLKLDNEQGLTDLFRDKLDMAAVQQKTDTPNLIAIPTGPLPPNPAELLSSEKMSQILDELKAQADIVLIDSPPSLVSDAVILASKVDGVVMVIQPGRTRADAAQAMLAQMRRVGANVIGVVMNRIPQRQSGYYGSYLYYYNTEEAGKYLEAPSTNGSGQKRRWRRLFERDTTS